MPVWIPRPSVEDRLFEALQSDGLVVLTGPRGSGKTSLVASLRKRWKGPAAAVQLEPIACTPEILRDELGRLAGSVLGELRASGPPFRAIARAVRHRPEGSLLLLDDIAELRTLSYFPDVSKPLETVVEALQKSDEAALVTTRFAYRARTELPLLNIRELPRLSVGELESVGVDDAERLLAASGGIPVHARHLAEAPLDEALTLGLQPGGPIESECRAALSELLHRARGYGACKAALRVLADEEGLKLSEVARRMERTPGSTRDYLRWLEEVDLLGSRNRRYFFADPVLRLWHRLFRSGSLFSERVLEREVETYLDGLGEAHVTLATDSTDAEAEEVPTFTLPETRKDDLVEID